MKPVEGVTRPKGMWSRCLILPHGLGQCPTHSGWSNKLDEWISQQPGVSQLLMHTWAHPGLSHFSQQPCEVVLAAPSSMGTGQWTGQENTRAEGPCSRTSVQMRFRALPESPFWPKVPLMRSWMSMWVWTIAFVSSCFSGPHFRKLKHKGCPGSIRSFEWCLLGYPYMLGTHLCHSPPNVPSS